MDLSSADFDRIMMMDLARNACEEQYMKDPLDSENLLKWGGALLELSQFQSVADAKIMLDVALSKFEEVLKIDPGKHEALWFLGNAYSSQGFLNPDSDVAQALFDQAADYFQRAETLNPGNEVYLKSMEVATEGPKLHKEIHKHGGMIQQALAGEGGGPSASSNASGGGKKKNNKKKNNDFTYDVCGWIILAFGIVAWVGMAKSLGPPPPAR
ncbi:Mitochondrial import receptor subunit TOM20-2 [Hirschfeldia incana]|nr:Mitochondrial import receptor subunit TOM20-2 [Hirschfeldia incana]